MERYIINGSFYSRTSEERNGFCKYSFIIRIADDRNEEFLKFETNLQCYDKLNIEKGEIITVSFYLKGVLYGSDKDKNYTYLRAVRVEKSNTCRDDVTQSHDELSNNPF